MNLTFRDYQDSDRERLIELIEQFWDDLIAMDPYGRMIHEQDYGEVYTHELLKRFHTSEGRLIWACSDAKPVGFVVTEIEIQSAQNQVEVGTSRAGRVLELYVLPEHRDHGIGKALMREAELSLRSSGCDTIKIEVFAPNEGARRFYKSLGYSEWIVDIFKRLK